MSDPFSRLAARMDAITVRKMGKTASINDVDMTVIPGETLAELNALSGPAVSLVVFSSGWWRELPHRWSDRLASRSAIP